VHEIFQEQSHTTWKNQNISKGLLKAESGLHSPHTAGIEENIGWKHRSE
jgi:hypothetical protein